MIYMNLRLVTPTSRTAELIHALRLQMARTQVEPGCIGCRICQDSAEKYVVIYQEEWNSWEELEKHICSERFLWILELMEQSSTSPELNFSDVKETRGMEYVKRLRK
jgi:quinol monooxygenase YgiN